MDLPYGNSYVTEHGYVCAIQNFKMSLRAFIQSRPGTGIELILFYSLCIGPLPLAVSIPLIAFISIKSMKMRKLKSADLGFSVF
jgi:hypothetical protein